MTITRTARCEWSVTATGGDGELPPVRFGGRVGIFGVQDYLTPGEARKLAVSLIRQAEEAEKADGSTPDPDPSSVPETAWARAAGQQQAARDLVAVARVLASMLHDVPLPNGGAALVHAVGEAVAKCDSAGIGS